MQNGDAQAQNADITPKYKVWKPVFLAEFQITGHLAHSAEKAGVTADAVYKAKKRSPAFAEAMADAIERSADILEGEARRRAVSGVSEPVYYKGRPVGSIKRYSDSLLAILLRGRRPEVFAPERLRYRKLDL